MSAQKTVLRLIAVLLLGGCAESTEETELVDRHAPAINAPATPASPAVSPEAPESTPSPTEDSTPVDAERLLAVTLAKAKSEDKRIMIHLGAPW